MAERNNPKPCKHLSEYKLRLGFNNRYKTLQKCLKTSPNGRTSVESPNSKVPTCDTCRGSEGKLYFCLFCSSISCSDHTLSHGESFSGHSIAVDVQRAELYCIKCSDQVYDPDFDRFVMSKHRFDIPSVSDGLTIGERLCKRKRPVSKGSRELTLTKDRRADKSCYPLGLRGLNNLGNTCFMNSVLQALLHSPPLRNYHLAHRHGSENSCAKSIDRVCLLCDIDGIFSAVFSSDRSPYSPAQFLYSWWRHANLASYEQQDAHEFFISVLDGIHEKETKTTNPNKEKGEDCRCIAHRSFSGLLRSDMTCLTCGFTSTTCDPFLDISLNLNPSNYSTRSSKKKKKKKKKKKPQPESVTASSASLSHCLDSFTRPEKLGSDQKLFCQNCRQRRDSSKQLSLRKLPLVLSLHIKRFDHWETSRKIDTYLRFPFSLDMTPYLSLSVVRNRFGNRIFALEGFDESEVSTEFEIFGVVTHSGTLESGHYVTYLRLRDRWFRCDDAWINEVGEEVVRASQCYMIFYARKMINCENGDNVSSHGLPCGSSNRRFDPLCAS